MIDLYAKGPVVTSQNLRVPYVILLVRKNRTCVLRYFVNTSSIAGLSRSEAQTFLKTHNLEHRKPDFLIDSFETYKKFGFSTQEIIEHGNLFRSYPREHEQHVWVMEEGGFTCFNPQVIIRFVIKQ